MGVSIRQNVLKGEFTVPANDTSSVEIFNALEYSFAQLEINVTEVTAQVQKRYRSLNMNVRSVDGDTEESVFGRMGLSLELEITTVRSADSVNLVVVNNNNFLVEVSFAKLKLK